MVNKNFPAFLHLHVILVTSKYLALIKFSMKTHTFQFVCFWVEWSLVTHKIFKWEKLSLAIYISQVEDKVENVFMMLSNLLLNLGYNLIVNKVMLSKTNLNFSFPDVWFTQYSNIGESRVPDPMVFQIFFGEM